MVLWKRPTVALPVLDKFYEWLPSTPSLQADSTVPTRRESVLNCLVLIESEIKRNLESTQITRPPAPRHWLEQAVQVEHAKQQRLQQKRKERLARMVALPRQVQDAYLIERGWQIADPKPVFPCPVQWR